MQSRVSPRNQHLKQKGLEYSRPFLRLRLAHLAEARSAVAARAGVEPAGRSGLARMDDTFDFRRVTIDTMNRPVELLGSGGATVGQLRYDAVDPLTMTLSGDLDGRAVTMRLARVDHTQFLLLQRRFRWVQDRPFNR